ncbi:hypothetical protein MPSEU_000794600 [Mayamaea pseudoterrestris]|nr:hypothetical protein MPSEU_000794600 [Mayamaea pseudoterrestris]
MHHSISVTLFIVKCCLFDLATAFVTHSTSSKRLSSSPSFLPLHETTPLSLIDATSLESSSLETTSRASQLQVTRTKCITGVVPRAGPLNQAVAHILAIINPSDQADANNENTMTEADLLQQANDLIAIGAVWARMETLDQTDVLNQYDPSMGSRASSRVRYADVAISYNDESSANDDSHEEGDLDVYVEQMESLRYRRVLTPGWMEAGTDVRVYPEPRKFPACAQFQDPSRLLYEDTTFVVVDKPPMLPTQPDASNYFECCPGCVETHMKPFVDIRNNPVKRLVLCHRVDSCVGGCVVLSKDRNGQKVFQDWQQDRKLRKVYLAVTTSPVPVGMHIQWMWSPQTVRGQSGGPPCQLVRTSPPESRRKARQFWNRCVLEVVKCEPIDIYASDGHGYEPGEQQHYQSTIRLVTGRKHQVRAQLAALGSPIIRDSLYGPMAGITLDSLEMSEEIMDHAVAQCCVPAEPIGLQAHAILFGGVRAKAGTPWWGDRIAKVDK